MSKTNRRTWWACTAGENALRFRQAVTPEGAARGAYGRGVNVRVRMTTNPAYLSNRKLSAMLADKTGWVEVASGCLPAAPKKLDLESAPSLRSRVYTLWMANLGVQDVDKEVRWWWERSTGKDLGTTYESFRRRVDEMLREMAAEARENG